MRIHYRELNVGENGSVNHINVRKTSSTDKINADMTNSVEEINGYQDSEHENCIQSSRLLYTVLTSYSNLLTPTYIHEKDVRHTIYLDDGRITAETALKAENPRNLCMVFEDQFRGESCPQG